MELKGSKTDWRKQHILLDGFFYLIYIFCLGFVGCQPESEVLTITTGQENGMQLTESLDAKALTAEEIEHLNGIGGHWAEESDPKALTAFLKPEMTENNRKALRYESKVIASQEGTIPAPVTTRVYSLGGISAPGDSTIPITEQSYSETPVNLPILDEPGKADELIYVNFDQVDIRAMLKTFGDITGIKYRNADLRME